MLPLSTQQSISQAWNDHHARCKESEAGKLFYAQAKAFALGHYGEVKEMAEQARELRLERNFMKAPSIFPFDPEAMEKADEIRSYRMNSAKVKQLEEYGAQSATDL